MSESRALGALVALLCVAGAGACDSAERVTCPGVPAWPGSPPLNRPAGFATFDDESWSTLADTAWSYLRRRSSLNDDICVDAGGSPPLTALRIVFTPDMAPNSEPSVHWIRLPSLSAVYAAWTIELSPNWKPSPAGGGKMTFLHADPLGQVYANIGGSSEPHRIDVNTEWAPYGSKFWEPNVDTTPIYYGRWYRIEWYVQWESAPLAGDGVLRWWVNGVLNGDYRQVSFPFPAAFSQFEFAPTLQNPPPAEQFMYVSHTLIAAPAAALPAAAPAHSREDGAP